MGFWIPWADRSDTTKASTNATCVSQKPYPRLPNRVRGGVRGVLSIAIGSITSVAIGECASRPWAASRHSYLRFGSSTPSIAQRVREPKSRMPQLGKFGSVGVPGGKPPGATRQPAVQTGPVYAIGIVRAEPAHIASTRPAEPVVRSGRTPPRSAHRGHSQLLRPGTKPRAAKESRPTTSARMACLAPCMDLHRCTGSLRLGTKGRT